MIKYLFFIFSLQFFCAVTNAQTTIVKDSFVHSGTTVVIPGKEYTRSGYHNFFWGKHYRKDWGTAFRADNFFIDTAYSGLVPVRENGSRQSMGLRLKSKTGKEYVLRSVDKDFGNGLPELYRGTFISRIAKDQVSFGYPLAAITITPMINAAKIYHTNPRVVFVPQQKELGEYNTKYANQLYLLEERPDDDQHDANSFGNSKKVIGTEKLYENIFEDNDNSVDQFAFAKARLFDMLIGDWGRHADQWRWASFKEAGKTSYKPIPRDRDQAYTIFDGFYPFIATHFAGATQLESFSGNIKQIQGFNQPGFPLDIQFTNQLTEAEWVKAAVELQQAITDSVIEYGLHQLPPELYAVNGEKIIRQLKSRRDHLQDFAHRYYKYLAKRMLIYGSDKKEYFEILRINNEQTDIHIYKIKKDGAVEMKPFFSRSIFKKETKEVRLYGFKDEDIFKLSGSGTDGIKIRLMGLTKSDTVIDSTGNDHKKIQVLKGNSNLYDSTYQPTIKLSPVLLVSPPVYRVFEEDAIGLFTRPGLHIGLNLLYRPKSWKTDSLETTHNLAGNYGFIRKTAYAEYVGLFPEKIGKWDFLIKAKFDGPAAENYFGTGNNSRDTTKALSKYFNVFSRRFYGGFGISRDFKSGSSLNATLFYQDIEVNENTDRYINVQEKSLPVFSDQNYAGVEAGYDYKNVNDPVVPTKGIHFSAGAGYVMNLRKTNESFFKAVSSFAFYVPLGNKFSFAARAGGGILTGDANYYHLNKLSGNVNLRGYARERFYGKNSFYNNNEFRFLVPAHNFFFNGKIGLLAFLDNGRVWQPGEISNDWKVGYGGGIILVPFNKFALIGTFGYSQDETQILLKAGMFF
ncbi:MAG: BamA/TamA family outer membrane protein [Ferruginibacter sp.]